RRGEDRLGGAAGRGARTGGRLAGDQSLARDRELVVGLGERDSLRVGVVHRQGEIHGGPGERHVRQGGVLEEDGRLAKVRHAAQERAGGQRGGAEQGEATFHGGLNRIHNVRGVKSVAPP